MYFKIWAVEIFIVQKSDCLYLYLFVFILVFDNKM